MSSPRKFHSSLFGKILLLVVSLLCTVSLVGQAPTFVSFDPPDAGPNGTVPSSMNQNGVIAGWYSDINGLVHGFVRATTGQITEFDATGLTNTFAVSINRKGQIVGFGGHTIGHTSNTHGFLRNQSGFVRVDVPSAVDTTPESINDSGRITGTYDDSAGVFHGFLRDSSGAYTTFDAPNAGTGRSQGTVGMSINAAGTIAGYYSDSNTKYHGFVRDQFGNITSFDVPGAAGSGTFANYINAGGQVTGTYSDSNSMAHSYLRDASGNIVPFDMPGADQTFATTINDQGVIVGEVTKGPAFAGFRRDAAGNFSTVSVPVQNHGSFATSVTNQGKITGAYVDVNGMSHGFEE
jgi:predicted membrane protein